MEKSNKLDVKKSARRLLRKLEKEAATAGKKTEVYIAGQSDGMRQMFIRWHQEAIAELRAIKSERE